MHFTLHTHTDTHTHTHSLSGIPVHQVLVGISVAGTLHISSSLKQTSFCAVELSYTTSPGIEWQM